MTIAEEIRDGLDLLICQSKLFENASVHVERGQGHVILYVTLVHTSVPTYHRLAIQARMRNLNWSCITDRDSLMFAYTD